MISDMQREEEHMELVEFADEPLTETTWGRLVKEQLKEETLQCLTCRVYSTRMDETVPKETVCVCKRLARQHSYSGVPVIQYQNRQRWEPTFAAEVDVTVYGQRKNGSRFIRCDAQKFRTMETLVKLIDKSVGNQPKLLISCFGGAKNFTMTDKLEREFMSGIGKLATTKDVWMLTTGLNAGVSKLIGEAINRHILLNKNTSQPTVIGMTSWGTIPERTRRSLRDESQTKRNVSTIDLKSTETLLTDNSPDDLDINHNYFLLFDEGHLGHYINDTPRSKFVQAAYDQTNCHLVTIIVEGGLNTIDVILNDLKKSRPVVIVAGSGRLSNVLGEILENATNSTVIGKNEIEQKLRLNLALWSVIKTSPETIIEKIEEMVQQKYRRYLSVFRLGQDVDLTNTIFRAVFVEELRKPLELLELAVEWNCVDGARDMFQRIPDDERRKYYPFLFERALKSNRPVFVDYFLRRHHNPLETTAFTAHKHSEQVNSTHELSDDDQWKNKSEKENDTCFRYALKLIIQELYTSISPTWLWNSPDDMDDHYTKFIGCYIDSLYRNRSDFQRFQQTISSFLKSTKSIRVLSRHISSSTDTIDGLVSVSVLQRVPKECPKYRIDKPFGKQQMLRDLFLWSVYVGYVDIAFVLLLRLESRIAAALIAAAMAESLSSEASYAGVRNKYDEHRVLYEEYATECVKACYSHNEQLACQLLLREIPLFGNVTCMQVAIASNIVPFIRTDCSNHVLDQQWSGHLDVAPKNFFFTACKFILSLTSFGLLAPLLLAYRLPDDIDHQTKQNEEQTTTQYQQEHRNLKGIEDESGEKSTYWPKFRQFHESPIVKMFYEFIVYLWYLMVFSYMMLFHMKSSNEPIHWTEIYVIVTVSAAFIEDIRKTIVEFRTQMVERWHRKSLSILLLYVTPYILFYIGIGLHFASKVQPKLFTPARIVLAIDLELWYIFSLRFVSAIKLLGPKLFMMKNMMRYLVAAMYIILVCIIAYGVVSRALTMYSSVKFTVGSLFHDVFSRPYWFLYSVVEDEKDFLDKIMGSETSSSEQVAEATVTLILLFFHMLFINVLILNLLIAVFNFAINDIHEKNDYYWRYQRYELIREYFEKPKFAFPPVSLIIYILMLIRLLYRRRVIPRVFKYLATAELDRDWTDFENAATYEYARGFVEVKYRSQAKVDYSLFIDQSENWVHWQTQIDALNEKMTQMQKSIMVDTQSQIKQIMIDIKSILTMIDHGETDSQQLASS